MSTQTVQLKVTLPIQLQAYLRSKSDKFGLTMSSYVKNLIIDDVKDVEYPVFQASKKTEEAYKKAIKERDQAIEVKNIDEFFASL
ncbi:MAG: hypothetical protein ABFQ62_04830 [Patescibacteria group bacterium]